MKSRKYSVERREVDRRGRLWKISCSSGTGTGSPHSDLKGLASIGFWNVIQPAKLKNGDQLPSLYASGWESLLPGALNKSWEQSYTNHMQGCLPVPLNRKWDKPNLTASHWSWPSNWKKNKIKEIEFVLVGEDGRASHWDRTGKAANGQKHAKQGTV